MGNIASRCCRSAYGSSFPEWWRVAAKGLWWTEYPKWFYSPPRITHDVNIPVLDVREFGVGREGGGIHPRTRCNVKPNQMTAKGGNCYPMGRKKVCERKIMYKRDTKPTPHSFSTLIIFISHFLSTFRILSQISFPEGIPSVSHHGYHFHLSCQSCHSNRQPGSPGHWTKVLCGDAFMLQRCHNTPQPRRW